MGDFLVGVDSSSNQASTGSDSRFLFDIDLPLDGRLKSRKDGDLEETAKEENLRPEKSLSFGGADGDDSAGFSLEEGAFIVRAAMD